MSLGGPKKPKIIEQEPIEEVQIIQEDATKAGQRERRKQIISGGRKKTILSGIQTVLKQRLGV